MAHVIVIIANGQRAPFVDGEARVRGGENQNIADIEFTLCRDLDKRVLIHDRG
ncbi:hypothetical protein [Vibrio vulnificus YJ016]|uniref:Uncharacterized protein n=1 Tax=Vibrio vulnificus (strain YJ016) TaxID=196600 RepID=Q7MD89_VIBVY|nr:hypothetical protein [Vibrio vulnificus YJ016]